MGYYHFSYNWTHVCCRSQQPSYNQVLNPDLTFAYFFGSNGSAKGLFNHPEFSNEGFVYISNCENHCIQMYVSQFDTCGSGPGQLHYPTGLEIAIYYVVDGDNHCAFVFTTDGQFVSSWRKR